MKRNAVKALLDSVLHLLECLRSGGHAVSGFGRTPVLFDKVQFAMVLRIEIAQMTVPLDELLELRALICEVGLNEERAPAAAVNAIGWALEI